MAAAKKAALEIKVRLGGWYWINEPRMKELRSSHAALIRRALRAEVAMENATIAVGFKTEMSGTDISISGEYAGPDAIMTVIRRALASPTDQDVWELVREMYGNDNPKGEKQS